MHSHIIPFATLSPSGCDWIADAGEEARAALLRWGLGVPLHSSLSWAIKHLREVARSGSYGATDDDKAQTAAALARVVDWVQVTDCLTEDPVRQIAEELAEAVSSGSSGQRGANILSQFWFGALLARARLRPAVPSVRGRRPDFVIRVEEWMLSVEVKRPESIRSAIRAVGEAAGQIRDYGRPGFVALDLSLALRADDYAVRCYADSVRPHEQFAPVFLHAARELSDRMRGKNAAGRFNSVLGLFSYARVHAWHHSEPASPEATVFVEAPIFPRRFVRPPGRARQRGPAACDRTALQRRSSGARLRVAGRRPT